MKKIGLYLHIPFCRQKCSYCDFYSFSASEEQKDRYCDCLRSSILTSCAALQQQKVCKANTLYIGGGTPSCLGAKRLETLVNTAKSAILTEDAQITVECNPFGLDEDFFKILNGCGVNRISIGLQSAVDGERVVLGRISDKNQAEKAVLAAQKAGIFNISLDIMLGIPNQDKESLSRTADFCLQLGVPHISAYMLKLEEGTPLYRNAGKYSFPDEDMTADLYLQLCENLSSHGIMQYEISNFAKPGYESRHNLKYWRCEEYLGLGPSAHSFIDGKRFYYPRDWEYFLDGKPPVPDGNGGGFEEYAMLALRLSEGLSEERVIKRYGHKIPMSMREKARRFESGGFLISDSSGIRFTRKGFLVSNSLLAELL